MHNTRMTVAGRREMWGIENLTGDFFSLHKGSGISINTVPSPYMKAILLDALNAPLAIREVEQPVPAAGQTLVKVRAAALNHRDNWIQKGQYAGIRYPIILGSDGAGEVVGGDNPAGLKDVIIDPSSGWGGDPRVQSKAFTILGLPENGTLAEYVCVPTANLYPKPAHLGFEEAAAIPLAGVTAWRALFTRAGAQTGDRVLVTGAGGGVALFAIQFALAAGLETWVTSGSDEKIKQATALGAKGGANYKQKTWADTLKTQAGYFDVIIDGAGGDGFGKLIDLAGGGGRIVFYGGTQGAYPALSPQKIFWKQLSLLGSTMGTAADFAAMVAFIGRHEIHPVVDITFPLDDAQRAIERMANGTQFGKIVLTM